MEKIVLEICVSSVPSALAAAEGGADRVELCSALDTGGLTPSWGTIRTCVEELRIPVRVLIRPREGDFLYTHSDAALMCYDIAAARDLGAAGVVCGALDADGNIDRPLVERLLKAAGGMAFTFHRAFDLCRDPRKAVRELASMGVDTLLTSGQAATALQGAGLIAELEALRLPGLTVMPGCGVNSENITRILGQTGARAVHLSARRRVTSPMRFMQPGVAMGNADAASEYDFYRTDADEVRACRQIIDNLKPNIP